MRLVTVIALIMVVFGSALGLLAVRHESRKLFVQLQSLHKQRDALDEEWGRLQLEQATWGTHSRVEEIARVKLGMTMPSPDNVVVVLP